MIPVNKPLMHKEMYSLTKQALDSGWLSSEGPLVKLFETKFSKFCTTQFGAATNSGTTALHLALLALGIGKGDEVIVPAITIASCYFAVWYTGAIAVPVDVTLDTYTMDPSLIEKAISKKTKAIMPVHLYGHPCDMDPILNIAKKHHLFVIEDAAEAHGAEYKEKKVGSFGDISIFSFYANKIVTCGEGGMVLTNNKTLYKRIIRLRSLNHSKKHRFIHDGIGYNYQMSNLQAAVGLASLTHINESIRQKHVMAKLYNKAFKNIPGIITPVEKPNAKNVYWMYAARIEAKKFGMSRDTFAKKLQMKGIQTRTFFYSPRTAFKHLGLFQTKHFPIAEQIEKEGVYLPSGLGNKKTDFLQTIHQIKLLRRK